MFKNVSRKCRQNRGFTLMEVMVVVAILAVVVLIAVPSVIKMRQNMKFAERNDYAKSIYMAAQSNLTQMRSMGELGLLENAATTEGKTITDHSGYYYSASKDTPTSYDLIVPSSLDATVRNQQVIVEYHPKAGIVYAVYYHEGNETLTSLYGDATIDLSTEEAQRKYEVGYYCVGSVDALESEALTVYQVESSVSFENSEKGLLTVAVPAGLYDEKGVSINFAEKVNRGTSGYVDRLEIFLTLTGENGAVQTIKAKGAKLSASDSETGIIDYTSDSNSDSQALPVYYFTFTLDSLLNHKSFKDLISTVGEGQKIKIGDNISVTADVTFYPDAKDPIVMIESATIAGINPMYHSLTPNPEYDVAKKDELGYDEKPYILAVSNGRHLQNLSYLDADFAQNIESIVFTQQAEAPVQPNNGSTEGSTGESQPANGAKTSTNTGSQENNTPTDLVLNWQDTVDAYSSTLTFQPIEFEDFSYVPSILGNGVTIKNLNITDSENAGLFAILKDTKIQDIKLDETNTISGGKNTGALAGSAEGATIVNCETAAIVSGANAVQCNVGGLIGKATDTSLETCDSHATVTSGTAAGNDSSKNALGGLVGYAVSSSNINKTTLTSCKAHSDTTVTSAQGSLSDIGGVVGHAKNAVFNTCSSWAVVAGMDTDPENSQVDIPNNNLGGFVGKSEGSNYTNPYVKLSKLPDYGTDAGGFAGLLYGGEVRTLNVELAVPQNSPAPHVNNFGGIASICDNSAMINDANITVDSEHSIVPATNKAGGAFAILDGYSTVSDSRIVLNSTISSNQAAGFAVVIGSNVNVNTSYVLGSVSSTSENHDAAGFVFQNGGTIERCFANVNMSHGNAFVTVNGAPVKNCYGWIWGSADLRITQNCSYSYFVNGKTNDMVFYEELTEKNGKKNVSEPSSNILDTKALSHPWAVDLLNAGTPKKSDGTPDKDNEPWEKGNNGYSYPELKDLGHQGASSAPVEGDYPFGLIYEETYGTDKGYLLIPLSDDAPAHPDMPELDNDKEITDTAFYLYHITDSDISGTAHSYDKFKWISLSQLYTIYELSAKDYKVDDVTFTTYYPINSNGSLYKIRTPEQFANIDKHSGSTFRLEKSMTVEKTIDSFSGTMEDSGDITITATKSLVKNLSGTLKNLTVTGLTEPMVGTVNGGTITGCEVTASIRAEGSDTVGVIAGTLASGTIGGDSSNNCKAHGTITGTGANVGGVVGKVSGGTVKNVTSDVAVTATGENVGMFVGYAEGGSFNNCKSTVNTDILPFGHVKTESITGATHWTTNPPQGDTLSLSHFEKNFNLITTEDSPERIVATLTNCTFRYSDTDQNALMDSAIYYYKVDTKTYSMQIGTQHAVHFNKTTPKYKDVIIDEDEHVIVGTEVATDFYVRTGTEYHRLFISVTEETSNDTDSTDGINYYVFTFTDKAKLNQTIRIEEEKFDKDADISLKDTNLYKLSGSLPTSGFEGYYQIIGNDNYLTYGAPGYLSLNNSDPATLWYWDGNNAWGNKQARDDDAKIAVSFSILDGDSFPAPVKITITVPGTEAEWNNTDMHVEHFCLQSVSLNYPFEHIATAQQVFYPTT